jgi:hypothetical protein
MLENLKNEIIFFIKNYYEPAGFKLSSAIKFEPESLEYSAAKFNLNNLNIVYRKAKTTPLKQGQFVTLWQRPKPGQAIAPIDLSDEIDFAIIESWQKNNGGHFIFSFKELAKRGIASKDGKGGKRGFRVYPPWSQPNSNQAQKTKGWQEINFMQFLPAEKFDASLINKLFNKEKLIEN